MTFSLYCLFKFIARTEYMPYSCLNNYANPKTIYIQMLDVFEVI